MIGIVNHGVGNIGSVVRMLGRLDIPAVESDDPAVLADCDRLILPGVGAFDHAMERIDATGLRSFLDDRVLRDGVPLLGICLGMQLLARRSEEGTRRGLGWIEADVVRFDVSTAPALKVPHMGWNTVTKVRESRWLDLQDGDRFYFVHSFHMVCDESTDVIATTAHGDHVTAVVERANVVGVQFHPEKSHRFGMRLLESFAARSLIPER